MSVQGFRKNVYLHSLASAFVAHMHKNMVADEGMVRLTDGLDMTIAVDRDVKP